MILESLTIPAADLARRTGWVIEPQGACKGDRCVPVPGVERDGLVDVRALADRLGMPIVAEPGHGLYALGPESGDSTLAGAEAPDFTLPDWRGGALTLSSLRGSKVFLLAWASW